MNRIIVCDDEPHIVEGLRFRDKKILEEWHAAKG